MSVRQYCKGCGRDLEFGDEDYCWECVDNMIDNPDDWWDDDDWDDEEDDPFLFYDPDNF